MSQYVKIPVTATLTGFEDSTKFYLVNLDSTQQKDSAYLINGKLKFECQISESVVFRLYPKPEKKFIYANFWIERKPISLTGSKEKFSNLQIVGSPINTIYKSVLGKIATLEALENKLMDIYSKETNKDKGEGILKSISELNKEIINIRLETIATFNPSLVTIKELYFLRNDLTTDSLRLLFAKFPLSMKKTKYGEVISQYLLTGPIKIGSSASDISGKDFNKKSINLSLFKSKIVLLDFWASWCGSCRMSNKDLAELYKKYHASGFEIISFSLDNELEDWKNASNEDSITWINISDLMGFYSKQAANYKIRGLPHSFLIDQNGKIIQILSGYGKNSLTILESNIQNLTKK